jgi:hypothetical protein
MIWPFNFVAITAMFVNVVRLPLGFLRKILVSKIPINQVI